jgi:hypothetical protein
MRDHGPRLIIATSRLWILEFEKRLNSCRSMPSRSDHAGGARCATPIRTEAGWARCSRVMKARGRVLPGATGRARGRHEARPPAPEDPLCIVRSAPHRFGSPSVGRPASAVSPESIDPQANSRCQNQ